MVAYLDSANLNMHALTRSLELSFFKGGLFLKTTQENTWPTSFQKLTPSSVFLSNVPKTFKSEQLP